MEEWARFSAAANRGGIAFAMTFCLNAWLVYLRRVKAPVDLGKTLTKLEKYHVPGLLLLLYVWLTQSRGPLIALGAGYLILQIPRFKNTRMMTFVVAVLLVGGYMATSAYFDSYTNVTEANATIRTARQRNVQKRNEQGVPSDRGEGRMDGLRCARHSAR